MMLFASAATFSFAQSSDDAWKGIRFGYERTNFTGDAWDGDANTLNLGYVHAFSIAKCPLFLEVGGGLNYLTTKIDGSDAKMHMLGLRVPVNIVYKWKINDNLALKPYTGFGLKLQLLGKLKGDGESINLFDDDDMGGDSFNRFQAAWQIGCSLDIKDFNVGIGYSLDLNEFAEGGKMNGFGFHVGYNF